ncbi:MAG: hypothetical protein L3J21_03725 [Devosiaceae bacterium]|nr:hypothetical protein [Devosiaceae bacterium]
MIFQLKLSTLLNGVAVAALTVGLTLSPVTIDFEDGKLAFKTNSVFASDSGSSSSSDDDNDDDYDDDDDDDDDNRFNSRPMNLDDFLGSLRNGTRIVKAERSRNEIEIKYSDGWEEKIEYGRYELEAPNGRTIISRPATQRDLDRLNSAF